MKPALKHLLRYPFSIRVARKCLNEQSFCANDHPPIALDLYTDQMLVDCGRHLGCIAAHARRIGSPLLLRCSRLLLSAIANKLLGPDFLSMEGVSWVAASGTLPEGTLTFSDAAPAENEPAENELSERDQTGLRIVQILLGRDRIPEIPAMPYPMHPNQILDCTPNRLNELRKQPKAGLFFAGNQKSRYGRDTMIQEFGVTSRLDILSELQSCFPDRIAKRHANGTPNQIVLRDSGHDPIAPTDWMQVISEHQFFICCPGASQPVCHNVIESIAAGVIPIIEYGDRMNPHLTDGENAVCFRGRDGLREAVARIDRMSADEIQRLSTNAACYYDEHLDGAAFLQNARDHGTLEHQGRVSMPFHNVNLYSERVPRSVA